MCIRDSIVGVLEEFDEEAAVVLVLDLLGEVMEAAIVPGAVCQLVQEGADLAERLILNSLAELEFHVFSLALGNLRAAGVPLSRGASRA